MSSMADARPRFRRDLEARAVEIDGIAYVEATDPRSGANFRFYDFEHAVAEALDGRELGLVVSDARERSGLDLTAEQLATFTDRLRELGFLEVGDDDATHSGPAPLGMLPAAAALPPPEPAAEDLPAGPSVAPGSTEKLRTLGSTEKLPTLDEQGPPVEEEKKAPPVEEPPADRKRPPAEEPPAEPPPVTEPDSPGPKRKVTRELGEAAVASLAEPRTPEESVRAASPAAELEPLSPPAEGSVVAPDLDDDEETGAFHRRSDDAPTTIHRRPDDNKGTLFGMPFEEMDAMVAAVRARGGAEPPPAAEAEAKPAEAKPPQAPAPTPPAVTAKEPESQPPETRADGPEAKPERVSRPMPVLVPPPSEPPAPFPPAIELPRSPFPPAASAPELPKSPFPPAATPEPSVPAGAPQAASGSSPGASALGTSAEVPALVPPTPSPARRISPLVFAGAGIAVAASIGFFVFRLTSAPQQGPITVRTIAPVPGSTYRWFDATGTVKAAGERTLTFTTGGKVLRVLGPGTVFAAGDLIAEVEGAPQNKGALEHNKRRLAYYEGRLAQMQKENNRPEIRQAEIKIAEKKRLVAEAQARLARQGVIAVTSGEIAEALVAPGAVVKAGAPAVKVKGTDWRAEFELSREEANDARHLGFCRALVDGKPLECSLSPEGGDETHLLIDLPSEAPLAAGKPVRLAKARYDGVFVLPASALVPTKGSDRRVYVVRDGRAESYAVVLADQTPGEIVVTQGIEPGSEVVAEVPPGLRPKAAVKAVPAKP
jgi:multidrug efflux pump subunit AcrA (membrane-fusion protein)